MIALFVVLALAVVAGVAVLIARDRPLIDDDPVGSRPLRWSGSQGVGPLDLADVRFTVTLRGYRMDQVDQVLDDTQRALADRDARILALQHRVEALGQPAPDRHPGPAPGPDADVADVAEAADVTESAP